MPPTFDYSIAGVFSKRHLCNSAAGADRPLVGNLIKSQFTPNCSIDMELVIIYKQFRSPPCMAKPGIMEFLLLTAGVYLAYILYSIYQEKIFSTAYLKKDGTSSKFTYASATAFFPALFCYLVGMLRKGNSSEGLTKLPAKEQFVLGGLYFLMQYTINSALVYISYPTQLILSNLRLLTIYLIGAFYSRISSPVKTINNTKLFIGFFISIGIFLFNFESIKNSSAKNDYLWGVFLLLVCIVAEGFLVDSQAYVKKEYTPSSNDLFMCTNKVTFLLSFTSSLMVGQLQSIVNFIINHEGFMSDLLLLCVFGTLGQIFVYQLIKKFQPHLYSLMTVFRKIMTVVISVVMYGHHITAIQVTGVGIVFSGLLYQIYSQFRVKKQKV